MTATISRRGFVLTVPALWAQPASKIRQVDIVHHTHTDVGYTELPSVVRDLQRRYLDAAIDACREDRAFRWTVESLLGLDDWWRGAPKSRQKDLLRLVKAGQMDVMGMPFNQTPFLNAVQWKQMMNWIPADRWRQLNIRAAMQNDVNGFPRAGAMSLLDHGVRHLLMGLNADSGGPPFPRPDAFWWKMPDGRRLFVWHGEHYGSVMNYLKSGRQGVRMKTDDEALRAAHRDLTARLQTIEAGGYGFDRLILTFTDPQNYDNGAPFPTLSPFVAAWNRLGLQPSLRLVTATQAVLEMEQAAGARIPTLEGEWTDWWANGDASGPREVAASRIAKRHYAAALSPLFGPLPARAQADAEQILRDLCLFDEHTWGAHNSISVPYGSFALGQYVEKSALAYRPMGHADILLRRRIRSKVDALPPGTYVLNPAPMEASGWAGASARDRVWVEKLAAHSLRPVEAFSPAGAVRPAVRVDAAGWPVSASYPGMKKPLFDGSAGEFVGVGTVPPADRRTIAGLHAKPDEAARKAAFRESGARYSTASLEETPHTLRWTQEMRHDRMTRGTRTLELWRREPHARVTVRFDRVSSTAPEVLFLDFELPAGLGLPRFSSGGVPFVPYRDQLKGACRDYFGIDGWAHYGSGDGQWLWVTRDAPLVALGRPHVVERHQAEPANPHRILAMVFDNCWHTNFVADSNGTMEFQFDLVWRESIADAPALAETIVRDPILFTNPDTHEPAPVVNHVFRP